MFFCVVEFLILSHLSQSRVTFTVPTRGRLFHQYDFLGGNGTGDFRECRHFGGKERDDTTNKVPGKVIGLDGMDLGTVGRVSLGSSGWSQRGALEGVYDRTWEDPTYQENEPTPVCPTRDEDGYLK